VIGKVAQFPASAERTLAGGGAIVPKRETAMFTFETRWPLPFAQDWRRSGRRFETVADAEAAMKAWDDISAANGQVMTSRVIPVEG
jgi:hypothetical protein